MAKIATIFQGCFLILLFLLQESISWLFYSAAIITIIDLVEEIIILFYLPDWEANVNGLYWVLKKRRSEQMNKKH